MYYNYVAKVYIRKSAGYKVAQHLKYIFAFISALLALSTSLCLKFAFVYILIASDLNINFFFIL